MEVVVPDLGDFSDVEIIEVLVAPGDHVAAEQGLVTLETEKATMDIPSPAAGRVGELKVKLGDRVSAGDVIMTLEPEAAESAPAATEDTRPEEERTVRQPSLTRSTGEEKAGEPAAERHKDDETVLQPGPGPLPSVGEPPAPRSPPGATVVASFGDAHASPSVRKLARELGVELGRVRGSGRKGRVTADDVKAFVKEKLSAGTGAGALPALPSVDFAKFGPIELQPLTRIQRISGPRLHASWINIPHVTQHDEADITELEEQRQALKSQAGERGIRLTPLAFVIRACVLALTEMPQFKSSLSADGGSLVLKGYTHIGFAADTPRGLVVPVIRDADQKDIYELARSLGTLSERAREGKLQSDDIQGGVFSISSLGGIGGRFFTPIINAPEVAILGVSRSQWLPVYRGSQFVPRLILPLSLSYDHRVIDGANAVRFTTRLGELLGDVSRLVEAIP